MADRRKAGAWERRLKEIEREKQDLRAQIAEVRRWADDVSAEEPLLQEPRLREAARPRDWTEPTERGVREVDAARAPEREQALDFAPGPDGLDTKRVVMPRLERTDLLRPAIGGAAAAPRLAAPEHDRFRNYFGSAGLKRVREARRERGHHRARAIFMIVMVATLAFVLLQMVT